MSMMIVSENLLVSAAMISNRKNVGNESIASTKRIMRLSTIPPLAPAIAL